MATIAFVEGDAISAMRARALVKTAIRLNHEPGDATDAAR